VAGGVHVVGLWLTGGVGRTDGDAVVDRYAGCDDGGSTVVGGCPGFDEDGGSTVVGVTSGAVDDGGSTEGLVETGDDVGGCGAEVVG